MVIEEDVITKTIVKYSSLELEELSSVDVAVVGAGPSGLTAAYYLSKAGFNVVVFEKRFSFGGGTGPGGNMLPVIVFQEESVPVLKEFDIRYKRTETGLYVARPSEVIAKLAFKAIEAGAKVLLGATVNDLIYRDDPLRIAGVVWVWTPIEEGGYHVDPLFTKAKAVVDASGHGAEIVSIAARKLPELGLFVRGEKSAYVERAEKQVVEYTGRVAPGLYVAGMAVAAVYGLPRMGPIFGGMLLSGRKVAYMLIDELKSSN